MTEGELAAGPGISVELTDESEAHCLKLVFRAGDVPQAVEIFLHTTQAIDLQHKLSLAICELHRRDSELLLRHMAGGVPLIVTP